MRRRWGPSVTSSTKSATKRDVRLSTAITILFIGSSMTEMELLQYVIKKENQSSKFILNDFFDYQVELERAESEYYLNCFGIKQISYSKDEYGYENIINFLRDFSNEISISTNVITNLYNDIINKIESENVEEIVQHIIYNNETISPQLMTKVFEEINQSPRAIEIYNKLYIKKEEFFDISKYDGRSEGIIQVIILNSVASFNGDKENKNFKTFINRYIKKIANAIKQRNFPLQDSYRIILHFMRILHFNILANEDKLINTIRMLLKNNIQYVGYIICEISKYQLSIKTAFEIAKNIFETNILDSIYFEIYEFEPFLSYNFKKIMTYDSEIRASSIGKITLDNNTIFLSPGLNAIVGGRGSGKSLLLDKIVSALDYEKISEIYSSKDSKDRRDFLNQFQIKVYDGNNVDLSGHTFVFDYYNQGYAQELFKKDKGDLIPSLYFYDEFSQLKDFNKDLIKGKMLEEISFTEKEKEVCENLTSLTDKIVIISEEKEDLKLPELTKEKKEVIYPSIEILLKSLSKKEILPQELKDNIKIKKAQLDYISVIYGEIYLYNKDMLIEGLPGLIKKKYDEAVQKKNKKKKEKAKAIKHLRILIKNLFADTINRVEQINQIIEASTIDFNDKDSFEKEGETGTRFIFQKSLYCENLLDFLLRILYENFDSYKLQKRQLKKDKEYFFELIKLYCYHCDEVIMESKTLADVYEKLKKLDSINIEKKEDIFVIKNNKKLDLKKLSPGTRANFLLEYIFFKESKNPLLIDQPEDNIDNETIYERLTEWFSLSKKKRQIIVVTHDANIVINADSENVIICKQEDENIFDYENGALEYKDILSKVSKLLDGGKQAIERRLLKYGK